ncbi:MAG: AMP-binding protein [Candidatus Aenigmatarchaeota archaeon]
MVDMGKILKPVPHLVFDSVERTPGKVALMYKVGNEYKGTTYGEMGERIRKLSTGLAHLGLDKKNVAILSENRPEWPMTEYAVMGTQGIFVPIYERQPKGYVDYVLNDSDASAIVVSNPEELKKVLDLRKGTPNLRYIITLNGENDYRQDIIQLKEVMKFGGRSDAERTRQFYDSLTLKTPAKIIYTSGTTGEPKGALFDQEAISYNALASIDRLGFNENDVSISFLPLAHSFEANNQNVILITGGTIAYSSRKDMIKNMPLVKPTAVPVVPLVAEKIYANIPDFGKKALQKYVDAVENGRHPDIISKLVIGLVSHKLKGKTGGNIRFFVSGGAALDPELSKYFETLGLPMVEGYGQTEFCPVIAANDPKDIKHGYVGRPLSLVVQDANGKPHGGVDVKTNGDGELMVKGPSMMTGYRNKPELTQKTIENGWLRTGDIAEITPDGYVKIIGRKKRIPKLSSGEAVPLDKLEGLINAIPDAHVTSVVIANDKRSYPVALIFPQEDGVAIERKTVEKYLAEINNDLPKHEQIRKFEIMPHALREGFEITPTLKIKSSVVEQEYKNVIDRLYGQDV